MNPILSTLRSRSNKSPSKASTDLPKIDNNTSFSEFVKLMRGRDPKTIIDELRASGKMSESQYNQLVSTAQALSSTMK